MASDRSRPSRASTSTWANSLRAGSSASSATDSSAWVMPYPLRRAVVTSWSTSGNWSANAAWRLAFVRRT